jgi:hypothetical protein
MPMTYRTCTCALALSFILGCPTGTGGDSSTGTTTTTPPDVDVDDVVPRIGDPDPTAVQAKLDAVVGAPTVVLGRQPIPSAAPPFRDILVFKMSGTDYCVRTATDSNDCTDNPSMVAMHEALGLAIVRFEDPSSPSVVEVKFVGGGYSSIDSKPDFEPLGGAQSKNTPVWQLPADVLLDELVVDDVDGDGRHEFIVRYSYSVLFDYFGTVETETYRKRLLVVRDDLSLEASAIFSQEWNTGAANNTPDKNVMHGTTTFDPKDRALVIEWCEVDPALWDQCSTRDAVLCERPTTRIRMAYDPAVDGYSEAVREQLRPAVREWDDRCP